MEKKFIDPINFYQDLENTPERASFKRIIEMLNFLRGCGFKIEAWKLYNKPHWRISANNFTWHCRSHHEAFNHLYPFYYEEKQKQYRAYLKKRGDKIRDELKEVRSEDERK